MMKDKSTPDFETMKIGISSIKIDGGTQARVLIDQETVAEYAEAMKAGVKFPPLYVFYDGATYWLADGFHRYWASRKLGAEEVEIDLAMGSKGDAVWCGIGANTTHGLKRTNADKRKAVEIALREFDYYSDRDIAKHVCVHHETVSKIRAEIDGKKNTTVENQQVRTGEIASCPKMPPMPTDEPVESDVEETPEPEPVKRLGADGKWRSLPKRQIPPVPDASKEPPPVLDKVGQPIPPKLLPLWLSTYEIQEQLTALSKVKCWVEKAVEDQDLRLAKVHTQSVIAEIKTAYDQLKVAIPYAVCPTCRGKLTETCGTCGHKGFLSEFHWNTCIPMETKNLIAKSLNK